MLPQVKLNDFIHAVIATLIQWSRSRGFRRVFFETLYFSNQKSFSLDLLGFAHDFSNPLFFGNSGRDFRNKFCFLSKICTRFLEPENSGAKKNWS